MLLALVLKARFVSDVFFFRSYTTVMLLQRSMIWALALGVFAITDPLLLKESVTVAAPEHKPLLTVVFVFGESSAAFLEPQKRGRNVSTVDPLAGCAYVFSCIYSVPLLRFVRRGGHFGYIWWAGGLSNPKVQDFCPK